MCIYWLRDIGAESPVLRGEASSCLQSEAIFIPPATGYRSTAACGSRSRTGRKHWSSSLRSSYYTVS